MPDRWGKHARFRAHSVGTTPVQILAENPRRKGFLVYNNGTATVYLLDDPTLPKKEGMPISAGASYDNDTTTAAIYLVAESGTQNVRVEEDTD